MAKIRLVICAEQPKDVSSIQLFVAMYRPHAAREDTDLFPMLRSLVSAHEYEKEHQLFGDDGFEKMA